MAGSAHQFPAWLLVVVGLFFGGFSGNKLSALPVSFGMPSGVTLGMKLVAAIHDAASSVPARGEARFNWCWGTDRTRRGARVVSD